MPELLVSPVQGALIVAGVLDWVPYPNHPTIGVDRKAGGTPGGEQRIDLPVRVGDVVDLRTTTDYPNDASRRNGAHAYYSDEWMAVEVGRDEWVLEHLPLGRLPASVINEPPLPLRFGVVVGSVTITRTLPIVQNGRLPEDQYGALVEHIATDGHVNESRRLYLRTEAGTSLQTEDVSHLAPFGRWVPGGTAIQLEVTK